MWDERVDLKEVAKIVALAADRPNLRDDPAQPGVKLFDGGRLYENTGTHDFEFDDGTQACEAVLPQLSFTIRFPNGERVHISQAERGVLKAGG